MHYRDARHETAVPAVHAAVPPQELYRVTGLQHLPFNTVFQLAAARGTRAAGRGPAAAADPGPARRTGSPAPSGAEVTNASTTGLLDATTRRVGAAS